MRSLTIVIPGLPPKEASPNWSPRSGGHWAVKGLALQPWRDMAFIKALDARNLWERLHGEWEPLARATITVTFTVPDRRYEMDDANAWAAMKEAVDELTMPSERKNKRGAAILADDGPENLTWTKPIWEIVPGLDKRDMTTTIEVKEV